LTINISKYMSFSDPFNEALSEVGDGGFISEVLGTAYDSARFKRYHSDVMSDKGWNKEKAANEVIYQAATKMTVQGGALGIFGGLTALGAGATDITSLMYHTVEMCGVLAEIYGLDTSDERVKTFVLAGVSGDSVLTDKAFKLVELGMNTTGRDLALKPLVKTLLVPILKALGVKVGVRGGIKFAELIPVAGAVVGGGANCWMVNSTGHQFLNKLKQIKR
jgi:EcsC protein family